MKNFKQFVEMNDVFNKISMPFTQEFNIIKSGLDEINTYPNEKLLYRIRDAANKLASYSINMPKDANKLMSMFQGMMNPSYIGFFENKCYYAARMLDSIIKAIKPYNELNDFIKELEASKNHLDAEAHAWKAMANI